jgi:hypothetical protein
MIDWHRLFGLVLSDLFAGSPWIVELEKDLSAKRQLLDVVIVRRGQGSFNERLPDGLDPLADHNLISYKSLHEPLEDWTLKELTGHYVNYRKHVSGPNGELLPETSFRLLGVSTRYPQKLAGQVRMEGVRSGVYHVARGTDQITRRPDKRGSSLPDGSRSAPSRIALRLDASGKKHDALGGRLL